MDSIGFMPFKWVQKGAPVSVNPIAYELQRAIAIRKIYEKLMADVAEEGWFFDNDESDL